MTRLVLFSLLLLPSLLPAAPRMMPLFKAAEDGPARLVVDRGVPVVHLYGSHREMGEQAGRLLGPQVKFILEKYVKEIADEDERERLMPSLKGLEHKIPQGLRDEMRGLADGAGVPYDDILLANSLIDLKALMGCSTLTLLPERTESGELMLGRNLDWFSLGVIENADVLFIYHADGDRPAVASVSWPGMAGVTTGMNEHGLTAAMLISLQSQPLLSGLPSILAFRALLEEERAVDRCAPFFDAHRVVLSCNLSVADAENRALIVELNPYTGTDVRRPEDGFLVCTNIFASVMQQKGERDERFKRLKELAEGAPRHSFAQLRSLLGEALIEGDFIQNLQSMILLPRSRTLYLSCATLPAAKGKFLKFDLARLFAEPPAGPAPPAVE